MKDRRERNNEGIKEKIGEAKKEERNERTERGKRKIKERKEKSLEGIQDDHGKD